VGARLLRHPDSAQLAGATLLPEISDLPTISDHGRTYTFHIRPDWHFSPPSDAPVTAEVMRYSIERALSPKITEPSNFGRAISTDIVGVDAYRAGKAPHISGIHVAGDSLVVDLVRADPDFPERISQTYFTAVPLNTPVRAHGVDISQPIPSAGPYYIVAGSTLVLKRNPYYNGPRPHHFEAIVLGGNAGPSGPTQVAQNRADYSFSDAEVPPSLAPGGPLERRFGPGSPAAKHGGQRYFRPVTAGVRMIDFNTESGIFKDPRLRRAVNYAIDRRSLAATTNDRPWDDLLPPGIPGAGRAAIYPLDGPDFARARALAGNVRRHAILYSQTPDNCGECARTAATIKADLARIGIDVLVKPFEDLYGAAEMPGARWDLMLDSWSADFPDPVDFDNALLDTQHPLKQLDWGGSSWTRYADQRYLRQMRAAATLSEPARSVAYRKLEVDMYRNSPPDVVYAVQLGPPQIFSSRIGCQVFRPQDNGLVDLAALCLRGKS
jgi:peptide/nickel transport system substrate-binding protein